MIRVGLDLRATELGFKAHAGRGTGRYVSELVNALLALRGKGETENTELVPFSSKDLETPPWQQSFIRMLPFGRQSVETQLFLSRKLQQLPVDLIHFFSHGDAPAWCGKPSIVSVLDLIPLRFPKLYKAERHDWRFRLARSLEHKAIEHAAGVIAISEATKRDLVSLLEINPDKIFVTPLAVSDVFRPLKATAEDRERVKTELRRELGLPVDRPILLYVGGIDPRKNLPFLLKVLSVILRYTASSGTSPYLVIAGNYEQDAQFAPLKMEIEALNVSDDVHLMGFVPEENLVKLYHAADIFTFPSLYEGFGFPVLEAMACGLPLVAGNNSSIPEVTGTNYPLLPDGNIDTWVQMLLELLNSSEERLALSQAGIARAREFSWKRTAILTLTAYDYFSAVVRPSAAA